MRKRSQLTSPPLGEVRGPTTANPSSVTQYQSSPEGSLFSLAPPLRDSTPSGMSWGTQGQQVRSQQPLAQNLGAWQALDPPHFVMESIQGHYLNFKARPPLVPASASLETHARGPSSASLNDAVEDLLAKGAIEPAQSNPGFYSRLFTVPKKDGSSRPVINLKPLNRFITVLSFKMASVSTVSRMIHEGDWAISIDLKDAFFHVPIHHRHRRFLRFIWRQKSYQFVSCPFGLNTAPSTFTRVTRPVLHWCHTQGMRVVFYLDDILLLADTHTGAVSQCHDLRRKLTRLGFRINLKKSEFTPMRRFTYLGLVWDTAQMAVALPEDKREDIRACAQSLLTSPRVTSRSLQRFLGRANFACIAVPRGRLMCRPIQRCVLKGVTRAFKRAHLSPEARQSLTWWAALKVTHAPLWFPETSMTLTTDSSIHGWGATLGNLSVKGTWPPQWVTQRTRHINELEMRAVLLAVHQWRSTLAGRSIQVLVDNFSTVQYLKKEGGTKSAMLARLTREILDICLTHNIKLFPSYLPGIANTEADALSRGKAQEEWHLSPVVAQKIFRIFGTPDIDLFASSQTKQLPTYFTLDRHDCQSAGVDALQRAWTFDLMYAFPPPALILTVIQKFRQSRGRRLLLIAPFWMDAQWISEVRSLLYEEPRKLRFREWLVVNMTSGLPLPSLNKLRLTVWPLLGPSSPPREHQTRLPNSSLLLGGGRRQLSTSPRGGLGPPGARCEDWSKLKFL
jgi:hypothetical protein